MSVGGQESRKSKTEIKALFRNACCHTAAERKHASYSILSIRKSRVQHVQVDVAQAKEPPTSMKEIPTLQTSAWMPYCSPDILSGWKVKTIQSTHVKVDSTTDHSSQRSF